MVLAGIVLFNPNLSRLKENIDKVREQVSGVILIENGSENIEYLKELNVDKCKVIVNGTNKGIAYALNQILHQGYLCHSDWVLTLDQDSVSSKDMIKEMLHYAKGNVGIVCPKIIDRNFYSNTQANTGVEFLDYCITSGSLTNVQAWVKTGGFDETMFIDWVDWDFCIALRLNGFKILRTNSTYLLHELGDNTRCFHIGKHEFLILNRSPFRYYYIFRNYIYIARKYRHLSLLKNFLVVVKWMLLSLVFEANRKKNVKAMFKGMCDGLKMKIKV